MNSRVFLNAIRRELRRQVRYALNNQVDAIFHPQGRMVEDFIAHYCVERLTGLTDDYIIRKALYYYAKEVKKRGRRR